MSEQRGRPVAAYPASVTFKALVMDALLRGWTVNFKQQERNILCTLTVEAPVLQRNGGQG
jgi:hypothetical protein